jgi:hypothetical protein
MNQALASGEQKLERNESGEKKNWTVGAKKIGRRERNKTESAIRERTERLDWQTTKAKKNRTRSKKNGHEREKKPNR